nr:response regulator [Methylomarinum sp. Ch1-1]MDP4519358.1 response regulator [Methylomarinum sp. Ch1-1]
MNGIIGFIDLLTQSELTPRQLEQALLIKTSASNLLTIVNEILDFSSIETGNFKTETITFNIRECIENSITSILPRSDKIQIIIDIAPQTPTLINSDPIRIRQVITNLVGNACKYTKQGHIIIRCTFTRQSRLFISVSDTGIGIAEEVIKDLFHPFLQISEYAVDNELGTGLGLTISKNIIERLKGRIDVRSRLGEGSVFWFDIPVNAALEPPRKKADTLVTLVDPFRLRRKALIKQLNYLGYRNRCFNTIEDYQASMETRQDIILYAAPEHINSDDDYHVELARIRPYTKGASVIFITHQLLNSGTIESLALPCRSGFLQQLIENTTTLSAPVPAEAADNAQAIPQQTFPIFIADDNEINRLLLKSQLEKRSDDITLAEDGKQALSLLQQNKYGLILLDLQMPYYNGLELLEKIKQSNCINHNTPVIAITAHAQSHQRKKLIDAGFDECLIKPVLLEQLDEVLNVWQPIKNNNVNKQSPVHAYIEQMLEKTMHNKDLANVLFNKLFSELPEQIDVIKQALEQTDWTSAKDVTHKLHGSVGFCGFKDLQNAAHRLETHLSDGEIEAALSSFATLQRQIDHFIGLEQAILQNL